MSVYLSNAIRTVVNKVRHLLLESNRINQSRNDEFVWEDSQHNDMTGLSINVAQSINYKIWLANILLNGLFADATDSPKVK